MEPPAAPVPPPFVRGYTVEKQDRVRISESELAGRASWLKGETVAAIAVLGHPGGISVSPREAVDKLVTQLGLADLPENAGRRLVDYARFVGTQWPIQINFERSAKRYTVYLPAEAKDQGLLPGVGGRVVVFATGMVFEIWEEGKWYAHIAAQGYRLGEPPSDLGAV
jgi:hypothetical protein